MNANHLNMSGPIAAVYYVAQSASEKEAKKKTKAGLLSSKLNSLAQTTALVSEFVPIPYGNSFAAALKAVSRIAAAFGYSKSTSMAQNEPCMLKNYNTVTTSGVEECVKLTLNGETSISKALTNYGDMMDFDQVANFIRVPTLLTVSFFNNTATPGNVLTYWPVTPMGQPIGTTSGAHYISNQAFVGRMHKHWRGSMKYSICFVGANNITARIRIMWTPMVPPGVLNDDGKVISEVFLVRGRAIVNVTVPYYSCRPVLNTGDPDLVAIPTTIRTNFNGYLSVVVVDPIVVGSTQSATNIYWYVWQSCGEDFVFYGPTTHFNTVYSVPTTQWPVPGEEVAKISANNNIQRLYVAQADAGSTTVDKIVESVNDREILTSFADVVIPDEVKDMARADLQIPIDPYLDITPKLLLEQMYRVHDFTWSGASSFSALLHTLDFPYLLLEKPYLSTILSNYENIKTDIRVKIVVNSTEFHSGTLLITVLPYHNARQPTQPRMANFFQAAALPMKYELEAGTDKSIEFVIPFVSVRRAWNQVLEPAKTSAQVWAGLLGTLRIWVLTPLVLSNSAASPTVPVSVFAKFENIRVSTPVPTPLYVAQSGSSNDLTRRFQETFPSILPATSLVPQNDVFGEAVDRFTQLLSRWHYVTTIEMNPTLNEQPTIFQWNPWNVLLNESGDTNGPPLNTYSADFQLFRWIVQAFMLHRGSLRILLIPQSEGAKLAAAVSTYVDSMAAAQEPTNYFRSTDGNQHMVGSSGHLCVEIPHFQPLLYYTQEYRRTLTEQYYDWPIVQIQNYTMGTDTTFIRMFISVGEDYSHGVPGLPLSSYPYNGPFVPSTITTELSQSKNK
jgi:hypothetical protein